MTGTGARSGFPGDPQGAGGPARDAEVALLNTDGVIVAVNRAWRDFGRANGGDPSLIGVGASYLAICDRATTEPAATDTAAAIRHAVGGELPAPAVIEVAGDGPGTARPVDLHVASRFADDGTCVGAIVTVTPRSSAPPASDRPALPGDDRLLPTGEQAPAGSGEARDRSRGTLLVGHGGEVPLLEATPDGLMVVGSDGKIMYVNRQLEALSGYPRTELIGRAAEVLVPQDLHSRHRRSRAEYAAAPRRRFMGHGGPLQLRHRDGADVPVEISLGPSFVDGRPVVLASVRDMRQRLQLEERLRVVADLLDATADAVIVLDVSTGRRVYVNQAALDRTGYTREELTNLAIDVWPTAEDRARVRTAIDSVAGGRVPEAALDTRLLHRDGSTQPVELRITHRPPAPGDAEPGHVIMIARDLSGRLAAQERLRVSEESFRAAFEQAPIGMAVTVLDDQGHRVIARANQALADLLGVATQELAGRDLADFAYPAARAAGPGPASVDISGRPSTGRGQGRLRRVDGRPLWLEYRTSVIQFADLPGPATLMHLVDITERHQTEQRRAQRSAMTQVVADVTTGVLAGQSPSETYQQIVDGVLRVLDAENVTLALPDPSGGRFRVVAGVGPLATELIVGRAVLDQDLVRRLLERAGTAPAASSEGDPGPAGRGRPLVAARFGAAGPDAGLVISSRRRGAAAFTQAERNLLVGLVAHVALAIELGRARADQERLRLLEERQRIARDLHDHAIQDLIAIGMQLVARTGTDTSVTGTTLDNSLVEQLDHTVRRLRGSVFDLAGPRPGDTLTEAVQAVVGESARVLGHRPVVMIGGPVDDLSDPLAGDLLAVLREALSNVARHAHATATTVTLRVENDLVDLTVEDDGVGLTSGSGAGNGLSNIRHRAEARAGRVTVAPRAPTGTRLRWTARDDAGEPRR